MNCPNCKNIQLAPTKLEFGLPAMSCEKCGGVLLSILSYRDWLEQQPENISVPFQGEPIENSKHALLCSRCNKIMLKYRVDAEKENHIDLCIDCADVWLDGGEWSLLKLLGLHKQMTHVFNDPWQINMRKEKFRDDYLVQLKALIGEQDFENMNEIKTWLDLHPKRQEILHFLRKDVN